MVTLKAVPVPTEDERRADMVQALLDCARMLADSEIPADCFMLCCMDSRLSPPLITPLEYNLNHADVALMTDYMKQINLYDLEDE